MSHYLVNEYISYETKIKIKNGISTTLPHFIPLYISILRSTSKKVYIKKPCNLYFTIYTGKKQAA